MSKTTLTGKLTDSLRDADYSKIEERILAGLPMPDKIITFGQPMTAETKADLFRFMYGGKPAPTNYIVVVRGDDTQNQRHGGIRQYRSFEAYVNGHLVESWRDDEARHDYNSDEYLDRTIANWIELWEKALGCKAIRGEITNRVRLINERKR